jgi:hypothetical protein
MTFPVYQCKEWQCRYVFPDQSCCGLPIGHSGEHAVACGHGWHFGGSCTDRKYSIGHGLTYLECPCCGDNGAASDGEGSFYDGQALICGCSGWVSVDEELEAWINNGDEPCPPRAKCHQ